MSRRGVVVAALAIAAGALAVPTAASGGEAYGYEWDYVRADGFPASDGPAQTFANVRAYVHVEWDGRMGVVAELGAEPTPETDADLHAVFGTDQDGSGCVPEVEITLSTYDPGPTGERHGADLDVTRALDHYQGGDWTCSSVWLTAAGDPTPTDRFEGTRGSQTWFDYVAEVDITSVRHTTIPRATRSFVRVELRNTGHVLTRIRVDGRGRGLTVGTATIRDTVREDESRTVRLPVRLDARHPRWLRVTAHPSGPDVSMTYDAHARVLVRPRSR